MKFNNGAEQTTNMDHLSSSKRRFIENWRQSVSMFMENGNICRVTIAEVTPEPTGDTTKWHNAEHLKALTGEMSPEREMASPTLPAVKFSYCHVSENPLKHRNKNEKSVNSNSRAKTTLPPSPNGVVVQNGMDLHQAYKRRTSAMRASNIESNTNRSDHLELNDKDYTRKSSKLAREIYEKYNMKSKTHNALPGKQTINGYEQYSMPWRNKTFLSLPLRFNGTANQRNNKLSREKTYISEMKYTPSEPDEFLNFTNDWKDLRHW